MSTWPGYWQTQGWRSWLSIQDLWLEEGMISPSSDQHRCLAPPFWHPSINAEHLILYCNLPHYEATIADVTASPRKVRLYVETSNHTVRNFPLELSRFLLETNSRELIIWITTWKFLTLTTKAEWDRKYLEKEVKSGKISSNGHESPHWISRFMSSQASSLSSCEEKKSISNLQLVSTSSEDFSPSFSKNLKLKICNCRLYFY